MLALRTAFQVLSRRRSKPAYLITTPALTPRLQDGNSSTAQDWRKVAEDCNISSICGHFEITCNVNEKPCQSYASVRCNEYIKSIACCKASRLVAISNLISVQEGEYVSHVTDL